MKTEHLQEFLLPAAEAFGRLAGIPLAIGIPAPCDALQARLDYTVVLHLSGNLQGVVLYSFDVQVACRVAEAMLGRPVPEGLRADASARATLAELAGVAVGEALFRLEPTGLRGDMSPPSVVAGNHWRYQEPNPPPAFLVECQSEAGPVAISFALAVAEPQAQERRAEHVFVVDHSVFSRRQLTQIAARHGFPVDGAVKDAESALARYERCRSDFLLLDLLDLGMDEREFVDRIFAIQPRATIFVVTSARPQQLMDDLRARGVEDFLTKPVDEKELLRRMQDATAHRIAVEVEDGGQVATLTLERARGRAPDPTKGDLYQAMLRRGVCYGIDEKAVAKVLEEKGFGQKVVVARGDLPGRGDPAQLEFYFREKLFFGHLMKGERAAQDLFENVLLVQKIEPGRPLVQKFGEPTRGAAGRMVMGREVPGLPGWDPVREGPGVAVSEDGKFLFAVEKGAARLEGEDLHLEPLLEIPRSVSRATGDVNVHGSVIVWGDVSGGATITATGDVEIKGDVEGGEIRAGRNCMCGRVIGKKGTGSVLALGHVGCRYLHGATVSCLGDLYVLGFANQVELLVGGSVVLMGDQPNLCGGHVYAGGNVDIHDVGSNRGLETIVEIASETFQQRLDDTVTVLRRAFRENPPMAVKKLILADAAFLARMEDVRASLADMGEELQNVWSKGETEKHVRARGTAYPGSLVRIGKRFFDLDKPYPRVRFFLRGASIGISDYSKLSESEERNP
ncbi:MAG: DUF342 domain-containing protein [Planctomycetes bacterium]|nr:DUF342 domain-containing protein [Planctomycetota bacterium]